MSYTTREIPFTSLIMRLETRPRKSYGRCAQCAVIKSMVSTARRETTQSYLRPSPITPTERTGRKTVNAWLTLSYRSALRSSSIKMASARRSRSRVLFLHFAQYTNAEAWSRERVTVQHVVQQAQLQTNLTHFVFEQLFQRFNQPPSSSLSAGRPRCGEI